MLILTAPFLSETHFAPYHYCCGFDRYWYEYHLKKTGFSDYSITPYGNLYSNFIDSLNIVISDMNYFDMFIGMIFRKIVAKYALHDINDTFNISCSGWNVIAKK